MNYYNCIYMYVNKINGKRYVGQARDFNKRHKTHVKKSTNKLIIDKAFNKYGEENFDIIILKKDLNTQCLMNFWESYYIDKYNCLSKDNYNISSGGSNGNNFAGKTEEEMEDIKIKMSKSQTGKHNGELNCMYRKFNEEHHLFGTHRSEETKQKISKTRVENGTAKGKNNPRAKRVAQYDLNDNLIKIWEYIGQAEKELGIGHISNCCNGKRKTAGGFKWKYVKED